MNDGILRGFVISGTAAGTAVGVLRCEAMRKGAEAADLITSGVCDEAVECARRAWRYALIADEINNASHVYNVVAAAMAVSA